MKKIALLCFLFLFGGRVLAQKFSVGIIAGLASTDVNGFDMVDGDEDFNRIGVVAGIFVNCSFNDRTSVQMELLYATKGSLQPTDSTNTLPYFKLVLDYMEVPVLFKYKMHIWVNKESLDKLELEVGPSFGFLVSSTQYNFSGPVAFDREFNKSDILFNLGLNYYFSKDFSLDIRFANSVVPIRPNPGNTIYYLDNGEYNTTFSYTLRYTFR